MRASVGPLGDDKLPQHCELTLSSSRVESGSCSIYFNNFSSTTGVDPSVRLLIQEGRGTSDAESAPGSHDFHR